MKELNEILSEVLNNNKFIISLFNGLDSFDSDVIEYRLATILEYYLVSKDTKTRYSYQEIASMLEKTFYSINDSIGDVRKYLIDEQYFTHAFNGYKKGRIQKYGFNYNGKLSEEEKKENESLRRDLNSLEENLQITPFILKKDISLDREELYMSSPGTKTFYYAMKNSPERLYLGPLRQQGDYEAMIVGETKASYMLRVLSNKIEKKFKKGSLEYNDMIGKAKRVIDYYCTKKPCFALIRIKDIKDINISDSIFDELISKSKKVSELINDFDPLRIQDFFTNRPQDNMEINNMDNLVTLSKSIPNKSFSIVDAVDSFDLQQLFARSKGLSTGDVIKYEDCSIARETRITDLLTVINNLQTLSDIDYVYEKYFRLKTSMLNRLSALFKENKVDSITNIAKLLEELKIQRIKTKDYSHRKDIHNVIDMLKSKGLYASYLEVDNELLSDKMQYDSELHGISHTRRVNFFATILANYYSDELGERGKQMVLTIDKNHGKSSVKVLMENLERLDGFNEDEIKLICFAIEQHSLSTKENKDFLENVNPSKRIQYELILNIVKDSDKLDRVRLDPFKMFPSEGLDPSRLSLNYSKSLVPLSYETYEKLFEIIRIDKQVESFEEMNVYLKDLNNAEEFERKIALREETIRSKTNNFLNRLVSKGKQFITLNDMKSIKFNHSQEKEEVEDEVSRSM